MEEEQLISRVKTILTDTEMMPDSDVRMLYIFTQSIKRDILDYDYLKAKQTIINELIRRGFEEDIVSETPQPQEPSKNKFSLSSIIIGIFFFILIAGFVVDCSGRAKRAVDGFFYDSGKYN